MRVFLEILMPSVFQVFTLILLACFGLCRVCRVQNTSLGRSCSRLILERSQSVGFADAFPVSDALLFDIFGLA